MKRNATAILLIAGLFLIVVALNFVFFVDRSATEEDERSGDRSSYRSTPYGTLAFYTLLDESRYPVARFERPFTELKDHEPGTLLVISLPATRNPDEEEFAAVSKWVEAGGLLIIIDREIDVAVGDANIHTEPAESRSPLRALQPTTFTRDVERVALSEYATRVRVDSRSATYHYGDDQAAVLADAAVGKGRVVLLTDPHIVANNGIAEADNVILALNLLVERPAGKIAFDEFHHGYGSSTTSGGLMAYFRGTPVPWMMAQAGLIVVLIVYSYGRRFGRPLPLRRERRTTNLEFVSSMANITRLAEATDLAIENIYSEFRKRLCRFSGVPPKTGNEKLAAAAVRRARLDERELSELLARCEQAARGDHISDGELLRLVTRIRGIESQLGL
ncbi:MAG TPA: DUF4350 domain-containing protein [Blastocatellia bacterium]|nr:DUF4350 domain-containing protein [Blastocatellia bacterium]